MARYRGKKAIEGIGVLIILAIIIAIVIIKIAITLALFLFPLFILAGFLYYFFIEKKYSSKIEEAQRGIWLTNEEEAEKKKLYNTLTKAQEQISLANEQADSEGLSRNMDGSISLRSNRGKELSKVINENSYIIYENNDKYHYLVSLPNERFNKYSSISIRKNAFLYSLISYIVGLPLFILIFLNSLSSDSFSKIMLFPKKILIDNNSDTPEGYTILSLIGLALLTLLIGGVITKISFNKKVTRP
ncbi:MAG: hypothetical protein AB7O47_04745 [Flavobacteriales bacterium]